MPLHMSPLVSRRELDHPNEKAATKPTPLNYERVLKGNPNHDPATGRFSSGSGGRQGGTAGAPTEDAFGSPLRGKKKPKGEYSPISGRTAPVITHDEWVKGAHGIISTQRTIDEGFTRGTAQPETGAFYRGGGLNDPYFNRTSAADQERIRQAHVSDDTEVAAEMAKGPKFQFSDSQKARNYKEMFGTANARLKQPGLSPQRRSDLRAAKQILTKLMHTGSVDKSGKPTKRSTFS